MSWQAGALAVLAVALAAGFAWYERTRPDARIVALVGTLAAFAALGRIAFAAVPNVKPTTDIVLISGYALGGGPGFAVGAIAGLSSNFFFGQGPWTPWQMAAWGATGVIGAGLARLPVRLGRWPLAVVCGIVGFGFTAFQDLGDWVTFSDHSAGQLRAYIGQGLGFDAVHAAGCVVFALALGPALIRSIRRFARRLQVTWIPPAPPGGIAAPVLALAAALGLAGAVAPGPARAAPGPARARDRAGAVSPVARSAAAPSASAMAAYLLGAQNADGGFGSAPGQASNQLFAGWAALGLASAGRDLTQVARGGQSLIAYISAAPGATGDPGSLERTILVLEAAGQSARQFDGRDLVAALQRQIAADGAVSDQVNLTAFAILALRSAGIAPPARTLRWLIAQQNHDGGYSYATAGSSSDVDDTGAALEALAGVAGGDAARARAVAYLRAQQDRDGGFPSQPGGGSNAQSTAFAVQGLDAVGVDAQTLHRGGAPSPVAYLLSLTGADGHVDYARGEEQTPVWVTAQALMAVEGRPLPLAAPAAPATVTSTTTTSTTTSTTTTSTSAPATPAPPPAARRPAGSRTGATAGRTAAARRTTPRRPVEGLTARVSPAAAMMGRLVSDLGLVTAIALAPVGAD